MKDERSTGVAVLALLAIGLLFGAYLLPWFDYDYSSGRTTPPDGPQPDDETGVTRQHLDFWADRYEGDVEPQDQAAADQAIQWLPITLFVAWGLLGLAAIGELPGASRIIGRPVGMALLVLAFATMGLAAWIGWDWIPGAMGDMISEPYHAGLEEPDGYTRSSMRAGWYMSLLALPIIAGAWVFKFQAGASGPEAIREHLA